MEGYYENDEEIIVSAFSMHIFAELKEASATLLTATTNLMTG